MHLILIKKRILIYTILLCLLPAAGFTQNQEFGDYLLKKVGNLYILNVGANDGVKGSVAYNFYYEQDKRLPFIRIKYKTVKKFYGTVQVTQLFPEYCVVRIISKVLDEEPQGNRIVLIRKEISQKALEKAGINIPASTQQIPEKTEKIEQKQQKTIVKTVTSHIKDESYKPISLGFNYFHDYDQIAKAVTTNIITGLNNDIYSGNGLSSSSFSSNGGLSVTASKMITGLVSVKGGFSYIKQKSTLDTWHDPDTVPVDGSLYVKNWDFDIDTKITNWSLSLEFSKFSNSVAYFLGNKPKNTFVPRLGVGVNYATVKTNINYITILAKSNIGKIYSEDKYSLTDNESLGSYWGMHAVCGVDYYFQALKFFGELGYDTWFSDKFKSNFPARFGISVLF
ncbi:hypothetical protein ACFL7D_10885 [candidate division KSB1 bacterium]